MFVSLQKGHLVEVKREFTRRRLNVGCNATLFQNYKFIPTFKYMKMLIQKLHDKDPCVGL